MRIRVGGYTFGHEGDILTLATLERARVQTVARTPRPLSDGSIPGADHLQGEMWTMTLNNEATSLAGAVAESNRLEAIWGDPSMRAPGVVVTLDYEPLHDGVWKRIYGRCGRFSGVVPDAGAESGTNLMIAEFEALDPRHYMLNPTSQTLGLSPESSGGFIFPLAFPAISTITGGVSARFISVGGDAPTALAVTFTGDLTGPRITVDAQEVGLTGDIASDLPVTVDARNQTVVRADGVSMAGRLTRRTRLDHLMVSPGVHEISFSGFSPTNTGAVTISWRDATWGL